jgi:Flp pilus assembly protein TadG
MRLRRQPNERGQTVVEVAIALPVLLIVLFAIFQFGVVFKNYIALTDAVRVGARKAAVSRLVPDPGGTTVAAARGAAADLGDELQIAVNPNAPWAPGIDVTVTGTYPYELSIMGVVVASGTLSSSTTTRIE